MMSPGSEVWDGRKYLSTSPCLSPSYQHSKLELLLASHSYLSDSHGQHILMSPTKISIFEARKTRTSPPSPDPPSQLLPLLEHLPRDNSESWEQFLWLQTKYLAVRWHLRQETKTSPFPGLLHHYKPQCAVCGLLLFALCLNDEDWGRIESGLASNTDCGNRIA